MFCFSPDKAGVASFEPGSMLSATVSERSWRKEER